MVNQLFENGIPQTEIFEEDEDESVEKESLSSDDNEVEDPTASDSSDTEEVTEPESPEVSVKEKVMNAPELGDDHSRPVSKRIIDYTCRTTCRQNVVIVTVVKDGTEDTINFVCNLRW